ncbi:MAG: hypothetical protein L6R35_003159 [Caloplaca aegaea]|nr:MAG: hypothetical protein L6R35_003159 [Caloplaca aegaea]
MDSGRLPAASRLSQSTSTSDQAWLESILAAHPRLGQSKIDSTQSKAEQAQLNAGDDSQRQVLSQLNDLYEKTFPGLRYIVFVDGRDQAAIMEDMKFRIERQDSVAERNAAIKAMCEIAADRVRSASVEDDD